VAISRGVWVDDNMQHVVICSLDGYAVTRLQVVLAKVHACTNQPIPLSCAATLHLWRSSIQRSNMFDGNDSITLSSNLTHGALLVSTSAYLNKASQH